MRPPWPVEIAARTHARRIVAAETAVWEVAMHMPTVRVRVDAASQEEAQAVALSLTPDDFAEALVKRLQYTRPKAGDIVGTHPVTRDRRERILV